MPLRPKDWDPDRVLGAGQIDGVAYTIANEITAGLPASLGEAIAQFGPLEFTHIQRVQHDPRGWISLPFLVSFTGNPDIYFIGFEYPTGLYFKRYVDCVMVRDGEWRPLKQRIPVPSGLDRIPWVTNEGKIVIADATGDNVLGTASDPLELVEV